MKTKTVPTKGFTLIELMIVIAVIAILASIAYPTYLDSTRKSRRADAKAALLELTQFMERVMVENKTYKPGGSNPTLPFTESPREGSTKYYTLSIATSPASTATSYTLQAVPKNAQSSDPCGTLTIDNTGAKTKSGSYTLAQCW